MLSLVVTQLDWVLTVYLSVMVIALLTVAAKYKLELTFANLMAVFGNFWTAGLFAAVWLNSEAMGGNNAVKAFATVMAMEFFNLHSNIFFSSVAYSNNPLSLKLKTLGMFAVFYLILIGGITYTSKNYWVFFVFWWIALNRCIPPLMQSQQQLSSKEAQASKWIFSIPLYIGGIFISTAWVVPQLGITGPIQDTNLGDPWRLHPERVLAFGVYYFYFLGLFEWASPSLIIRPSKQATTETPA